MTIETNPVQSPGTFQSLLHSQLLVPSSDTLCRHIIDLVRIVLAQAQSQKIHSKLLLLCLFLCPCPLLFVCCQHVASQVSLPSDGHNKHPGCPSVQGSLSQPDSPASRIDAHTFKVCVLLIARLYRPPQATTKGPTLLGASYHYPGALKGHRRVPLALLPRLPLATRIKAHIFNLHWFSTVKPQICRRPQPEICPIIFVSISMPFAFQRSDSSVGFIKGPLNLCCRLLRLQHMHLTIVCASLCFDLLTLA